MNFSKNVQLEVNLKTESVFVQTDKSVYKPADKVNFRVLVLNSQLRAVKDAKVDIFITDGSKNRLKRFENVSLIKGVFQDHLQLSDLPVLGQWKIHVLCNGREEIAKSFDVAEYTLPKFEVNLDVNEHPNFEEGKIRASVNARYTFGKKAKGNATIIARVRGEEKKIVEKTVEVNGNEPIEFDIKNELKLEHNYFEKSVDLIAKFREELTGKEVNATKTVAVHITPHKIKFKKSTEKFKPGLPFKVSCYVLHHEKESPVIDGRNPLKIKIDYEKKEEGSLQTKTSSESYEVFLENGLHEINLNLSSITTEIRIAATYKTTYVFTKSYKLEADSEKYIQIVQTDKK